jgi:hypothetical protein
LLTLLLGVISTTASARPAALPAAASSPATATAASLSPAAAAATSPGRIFPAVGPLAFLSAHPLASGSVVTSAPAYYAGPASLLAGVVAELLVVFALGPAH